jgi:spore maturation protein CgeB
MFKFMFVDTYYDNFLSDFYHRAAVGNQDYAQHLNLLLNESFGTADFYSKNLRKLGHIANDVIFNDPQLQQKWVKEHTEKIFLGHRYKPSKYHNFINKSGLIPWQAQNLYKILKEQIEFYKPDVLYIQDMAAINSRFLMEIKTRPKLIVGQIACGLSKKINLKAYDLVISSFPHFVDKFNKIGVNSEYLKIGFEDSIWDKINGSSLKKKYNCVFIGGLKKSHYRRIKMLESLAERLELNVWGYGINALSKSSPLRGILKPPVWGLDMYRILAESRIALNIHLDAAGDSANNMRLYETTGCGAMLLTDYKDNLNKIFSIGKEVIAYRGFEELLESLKYYNSHDQECREISRAGQERTLREHTYFNRMKELTDIIKKHIKCRL